MNLLASVCKKKKQGHLLQSVKQANLLKMAFYVRVQMCIILLTVGRGREANLQVICRIFEKIPSVHRTLLNKKIKKNKSHIKL